MRIHDLHSAENNGRARVAATVTWEDCDQPRREVFFETEACFAAGLTCNPNAFLLAAFAPAMRHGERRVRVEGRLCPKLRNGVITAMQLLRRWYGQARHQPLLIEATHGFHAPLPVSPQRAASFMSGGVDSLATLRSNRLDIPLGHPESIQHCFFVHGFDFGGYEGCQPNLENYARAVARLAPVCDEAKATLIPVYTNLRFLEGAEAGPYNNLVFTMESHGAALAAIAHTFSRCASAALIPSTDSVEDLVPRGSHPLLDPHYSSAGVRVQHDGLGLSRLAKVSLLARWDSALLALRTCADPLRQADLVNCGRCEKCLRTMIELLVCDKLHQCPTYPFADLTPEHIQSLEISWDVKNESALRRLTGVTVSFWRDVLEPLRQKGRHDLVAAVEAKLAAQAEYQAAWQAGAAQRGKWHRGKAALKSLDARYLGGALLKLKRRLSTPTRHDGVDHPHGAAPRSQSPTAIPASITPEHP